MEALLWEWSLAVFLERVCDTKMALGKAMIVTRRRTEGEKAEDKDTSKRWFK